MIRLRDIITEITLGSVTPYATQFTWHSVSDHSEVWEAEFQAESTRVVMNMLHGGEGDWYFAFLLPTQDATLGSGRTTSHAKSAGTAGASYIRIVRTVGEAVLDFCATHAPEAVSLSGADSDDDKASQKTRIYAAMLRDAAPRLAQAGYRVMHRGYPKQDALWIVRTNSADSTGIENQ